MGSPEPKSDQSFSVMDASKPTRGSTDSSKVKKQAQLASDYNAEDFPVSFMPTINEQLSDGSAAESAPSQVMDPTGESSLPDPNRIPSHVFDRTKSTAPVEWSVASNESLFSIHMGNMSFTNEQMNWMIKSGELGLTGDSQFLGDVPYSSLSPTPPQVNKSPESSEKNGKLKQGLGATEAAAAETMREVIRENASDHNNNKEKAHPPKADPRTLSSKRSDDSSIKSFAFPILTGVGNKSRSMSINKEKKKKQHSPPSTPKTAEAPEKPGAEPEPLTPKQQQTPKTTTTKNAGLAKWFSCFSCCSVC